MTFYWFSRKNRGFESPGIQKPTRYALRSINSLLGMPHARLTKIHVIPSMLGTQRCIRKRQTWLRSNELCNSNKTEYLMYSRIRNATSNSKRFAVSFDIRNSTSRNYWIITFVSRLMSANSWISMLDLKNLRKRFSSTRILFFDEFYFVRHRYSVNTQKWILYHTSVNVYNVHVTAIHIQSSAIL